MEKSGKLYLYFGWIEAKQNEIGQSQIRICDNFSSKIVQFNLTTSQEGIVQLAATEQHILLLDGSLDGPIWLYQIQTQALFKLPLSTLANDGFQPTFQPVREIPIKIEKMDDDRLDAQFSHWDTYQRREWTNKRSKKQSETIQCHHFLVCTAFNAFLAINNCWGNGGAKLICLFQKERPQFSIDEQQPCCSTSNQFKSCPPPYFCHKLPFHIKKVCGGNDNLVLISSAGHVYTMGTGTKGELAGMR